MTDDGEQLVIADTRDQVRALNAAIRDHRHGRHNVREQPGQHSSERSGERSGEHITGRGERIGLGDRVATRRNDRDLAVANRDTWTVTKVGEDGSLYVSGRNGERALPAGPLLTGGRDVARKWGEIVAYADKRGRPRPVNAPGSQPVVSFTSCRSPP